MIVEHAFVPHPDGRDRCRFVIGRELETGRQFRCWQERRAHVRGDVT